MDGLSSGEGLIHALRDPIEKTEGYGYRMLASRVADLGVWTTRSSVERLIKRRPPYQDLPGVPGLDHN